MAAPIAARRTGEGSAPAPAELPVPAEAPAPAESEAPAANRAHGLVRAAEHSHRSDVAALRQWINHPDLRSELAVPDLTTEHKGNGFQKAVAAYQAASAIGTPTDPVVTDPVVTDPTPVVISPDPVVTDPVVTDPTPVVISPDPIVTDPVVTDPELVGPEAVVTDPAEIEDPAA